jgi:DNA-binding MarR family transcriptional regulator
MIRYKVTLTPNEREQLQAILSKGKHSSLQFRNACILLNCDEGENIVKSTNEQIAKILQITPKTVERLKQRFVEEGFESCIDRK